MRSRKRDWPESPEDERRLVERLRAGEERAFETFARSYVPALYRFAGKRLDHDRDLTQEVVQSTLCHALAKLEGFRAEAALFTWLCACCVNEIAAHYRRAARRPREVELEDVLVESLPGAEWTAGTAGAASGAEADTEETAERVHLALDRMPPDYAEAVEWRYLQGLAVTEIARRRGSSYKATESLLSRARATFRRVYEELAAPGARSAASARPLPPRKGVVP